MKNVSTSLTLVLKIFLPVAWIVFFGTITIALLFSEQEFVGMVPTSNFKFGMLAFFLAGVAILYWAVMRLKRVDMDELFIYVTNYHKNYRYPFHNIEKIVERDYWLFKTLHIYLREPGNFGKKISFIPSKDKFKNFLEEHPEVVKQLWREEA
ncbi:MAG: hypothetical protein AB8G15_09555 [Saprospiraceae bacterium]